MVARPGEDTLIESDVGLWGHALCQLSQEFFFGWQLMQMYSDYGLSFFK